MMNKISETQLYYIKINLAIPARVKVEVTLNFLATGNTYRTLQHLLAVADYNYYILMFDLPSCNPGEHKRLTCFDNGLRNG